MKRVIVTGGTGFVGANLSRRLLADGHEVQLLVHRGSDPWRIESIRNEVNIHEVELEDGESVATVVHAIRPDWVFHLAAHGGASWQTDTRRMVQANLVGTINLVESCLKTGFEAFLHAGSSSEYGLKDHAPSEDEVLVPNSSYAVTKAAATTYCSYMGRTSGSRMATLRLYSVYGPYEDPRRFVPTLIVHGLSGKLPPLVSPDTARDFLHVKDVEDAFLRAVTSPNVESGEVFNLGTGVQTTISEAVETAREIMGIEVEPRWGSMPARDWDTEVWVADSRKARQVLGWAPRFAFRDGFADTVRFFREHGSLLEYYRRVYELAPA